MATFKIPDLSLEDARVSRKALAYYRKRFKHAIWTLLIREVDRLIAEHKITQVSLAKRLGKDTGAVSRWLSAPGNRTLDTLSDLFVGIGIDPRRILSELATPHVEVTEVKPGFGVNGSPFVVVIFVGNKQATTEEKPYKLEPQVAA